MKHDYAPSRQFIFYNTKCSDSVSGHLCNVVNNLFELAWRIILKLLHTNRRKERRGFE